MPEPLSAVSGHTLPPGNILPTLKSTNRLLKSTTHRPRDLHYLKLVWCMSKSCKVFACNTSWSCRDQSSGTSVQVEKRDLWCILKIYSKPGAWLTYFANMSSTTAWRCSWDGRDYWRSHSRDDVIFQYMLWSSYVLLLVQTQWHSEALLHSQCVVGYTLTQPTLLWDTSCIVVIL